MPQAAKAHGARLDVITGYYSQGPLGPDNLIEVPVAKSILRHIAWCCTNLFDMLFKCAVERRDHPRCEVLCYFPKLELLVEGVIEGLSNATLWMLWSG